MVKNRAKRHFSKSAATYDEHAALQRDIEDKLIQKFTPYVTEPGMILDIGAGTCAGSKKLSEVYPASSVVASDIAHGMMKHARRSSDECALFGHVTADMERLPFKADTFDVIYSSAAAHWGIDQRELFERVNTILKAGGTFCFSTFGADTLPELDRSFSEAYRVSGIEAKRHVNKLAPFDEIVIELSRAGFCSIKSEIEERRVTYPDVKALMRSLKAIGSHRTDGGSGFLGRRLLDRMISAYEKEFGTDDGIYATYVVYYFICSRG